MISIKNFDLKLRDYYLTRIDSQHVSSLERFSSIPAISHNIINPTNITSSVINEGSISYFILHLFNFWRIIISFPKNCFDGILVKFGGIFQAESKIMLG